MKFEVAIILQNNNECELPVFAFYNHDYYCYFYSFFLVFAKMVLKRIVLYKRVGSNFVDGGGVNDI